jgi:AraC-like DNA-binding protein
MAGCGFWLAFLNFAIIENSNTLLTYYYPVSLIIVMFIGPSIYMYVRLLLGYVGDFNRVRTWLHAIPSLPAICYSIYFATLPAQTRITWLYADYDKVRWQEYVINNLFYIQLISYIISCLWMVIRQSKKSKLIEFGGKLIDISWLRYFFIIALTFFFIEAFICTIANSDRLNTLIGLVFMDVLFVYFFINSIWKTGLFIDNYTELPKTVPVSLKLQKETVENYFTILAETMDRNKLYLSENCTIEDVAETTHIPKHHLSHILNSHLNKSFSDFINEYRIKYACQLIKDKNQGYLTLEAIGLKCGFGSKTTFNRAFKKHSGLTPSEFKQSNS